MRPIRLLTFVVLLAPGAAAAESCEGGPKSEWRSVEEVRQVAADHGFGRVVKVILEDGCYEAVTLAADGKIVGVHFDPVTLKLHKVEAPR